MTKDFGTLFKRLISLTIVKLKNSLVTCKYSNGNFGYNSVITNVKILMFQLGIED